MRSTDPLGARKRESPDRQKRVFPSRSSAFSDSVQHDRSRVFHQPRSLVLHWPQPPKLLRLTFHHQGFVVVVDDIGALVAHLVGDWMLQNDWMARHKQAQLFNMAIALHCMIYTFVIYASLWLFTLKNLTQSVYLLFSLLILLSHWVIDATALARHWAHFFKQSDQRFVHVMVDQTMHVVVLACLIQFLL